MRRLPLLSGLAVAGALVIACGGNGPAASNAVPSIAVPSIALPSFALPSFDLSSFAIPSFAFPSFNTNADPELAAKFPQQIGGQPVTDVQTVNFITFMQAFAGDDPEEATKLQAFVQLLNNNGINPATLAFASGKATINDSDVEIQAFRTPGASAASFINLWPQLQAIDNNGDALPTQGQATVGGKQVVTFTDPEGNVSYVYPSGDTAWSIDNSDEAEAGAVFSALP